MDFNIEDLLYINLINNRQKKENARYEKLAEKKHKFTNLPQWYLWIKQ